MAFDLRDYRACGHPATMADIEAAEVVLAMPLGLEVRNYLTVIGRASGRSIDYFGLGADVPGPLNIVNRTLAIREAKHWTEGYVALAELPNGQYVMCDRSDRVYLTGVNEAGFVAGGMGLMAYMASTMAR